MIKLYTMDEHIHFYFNHSLTQEETAGTGLELLHYSSEVLGLILSLGVCVEFHLFSPNFWLTFRGVQKDLFSRLNIF